MMSTPPNLDLTSLRWSMAVARAGGFRRAAGVLGVEQSALSRRIRRLEDDLGVSLFQRSARGTALTNAGQLFTRRIEALIVSLGLAVSDARAAGEGQVGRLRIGMTFSLRSRNLLKLIDQFHGAHPRVQIDLSEGRASEHMASLADQRLDVAVLPGGLTVSGLDVSVLWRERWVIALPLGHALLKGAAVRSGDLRGTRLLVSERDSGSEAFARFALRAEPDLDIEVADCGAGLLLEQTRMGRGLTILGAGALADLRCDVGLAFRPVSTADGDRLAITAAWSPKNDNPVLRRFVSGALNRRSILRMEAPREVQSPFEESDD